VSLLVRTACSLPRIGTVKDANTYQATWTDRPFRRDVNYRAARKHRSRRCSTGFRSAGRKAQLGRPFPHFGCWKSARTDFELIGPDGGETE